MTTHITHIFDIKQNTTLPASSSRCHQGGRGSLLRESEAWFAAARPRLLRLARARGVPPETVEDVVQETLLEAWKHLERLHTPTGVHLWLDEICRNICRRYERRRALDLQRFALLPIFSPEDDASEDEESASSRLQDLPDTQAFDPVEALNDQDRAVLLDRALGALSGSAREAVKLSYLEELPQREVAARLGLSLSALEARLHRARQQLRQVFSGPLRAEARAFGLALDSYEAEGWQETRLWCTLCGQQHLRGLFLEQPDGSVNLHMQCPACEQRYGLDDLHSSNVHSKGLVSLAGLQAFRPAWKRTMQTITQRFTAALALDSRPCLYCGAPTSLRLIDKLQAMQEPQRLTLPSGLEHFPYQFWAIWDCARCGHEHGTRAELFAVCDLVYWSHERTRQFMQQHPRWISEPEMLVEYMGQPAIRLQMTDLTSNERLTVLAQRQTLRPLAFF